MPQATIKLQPAPAAAALRKPAEAAPATPAATAASTAPAAPTAKASNKVDAKAVVLNTAKDDEDSETEVAASEIPFPLVIAVAALAFIAFGIQLWTFLAA
jgi:hypothetical protein